MLIIKIIFITYLFINIIGCAEVASSFIQAAITTNPKKSKISSFIVNCSGESIFKQKGVKFTSEYCPKTATDVCKPDIDPKYNISQEPICKRWYKPEGNLTPQAK